MQKKLEQNALEPQLTTIAPIAARSPQQFLTLIITSEQVIYTTTILLGNNFFTTVTSSPAKPTFVGQLPEVPGIPTSSIVGIVVGCISVFLLLLGVFYIYTIRAKQYTFAKKRRKRTRSKIQSLSEQSGSEPGYPPSNFSAEPAHHPHPPGPGPGPARGPPGPPPGVYRPPGPPGPPGPPPGGLR